MASDWASFIADLRHRSDVRSLFAVLLVVLGPILVVLTFLALQPLQGTSRYLRLILTCDLVYVLVVATLVVLRISNVVSARRAKSSGSRLHLRLSAVFASLALVPTVLVAVFAMLTVNQGLESWFSDRVRNAVGVSLSAATSYQNDQKSALVEDLSALGVVLNREGRTRLMDDGALRQALAELGPQVQRGLKELFVIDNLGELRVRGPNSYLFNFDKPSLETMQTAEAGDAQITIDPESDEIRGILKLEEFPNHFLYVTREIDGTLAELLDETAATAVFYQQLEQERGRLIFDFGVLYIVFALILVLAATWVGLWFAERLANPIGEMTAAARRVGGGDLTARVENLKGDDEISMLGRYFNQMTKQLKGQRDNLIQNAEQADRRRRLFDSVLSSVTSGVLGVDQTGKITFVNRAAHEILALEKDVMGAEIADCAPEFIPLLEDLRVSVGSSVRKEIKLVRKGKQESLLVQVANRTNEHGEVEGTVIAIEDVTDLVSAQRMAAWGDVARRIAHEIKNPLTPIKLSADRIQRKFAPALGAEAEKLEAMTGVIVRQTDDLRRIVDEFSKFARMPQPEKRMGSFGSLLKDVVSLQESGQPEVSFDLSISEGDIEFAFDQTMLRQALTNLIKNAGEAIEMRMEFQPLPKGCIEIKVEEFGECVEVKISDNGLGLPEDRSTLFEPYVTHRDEGTGLGLPIVVKIIEEHGGTLTLDDRIDTDGQKTQGATATILLPLLKVEELKSKEVSYG